MSSAAHPASPEAASNSGSAATADPIVIDLGKRRRKLVKQLREGRGRLMDDVNGVLAGMRADGALAADVQPVVIVVRERRRRQGFWPAR